MMQQMVESAPPEREPRLDTPARLWLMLVLAVAAVLAAGCVAGIGLSDRQSAAKHTDQGSATLYVDMQDLSYDLTDANAAAATSLLVGSETPAPFSNRFNSDINDASNKLAAALQQVAGDANASQQLQWLATQIPEYTARVGEAQVNNRFGTDHTVAGAYMRSATDLLTVQMLAETRSVIAEQQTAVQSGVGSASSFPILLTVIVVMALAALILIGMKLARLTHRRVNLGLLGGALAVLALFVWSLSAFSGAAGHANAARTDFADLSQAKDQRSQLALTETYVALQQIDKGEDGGTDASNATTALGAASPIKSRYSNQRWDLSQSNDHSAVEQLYQTLSACANDAIGLATKGDYSSAITATVGGGTSVGEGGCEPVAYSLAQSLKWASGAAKTNYDRDMSALSSDYYGSAALPLAIAIGVLGAAAAAYGLNRRLGEYR